MPRTKKVTPSPPLCGSEKHNNTHCRRCKRQEELQRRAEWLRITPETCPKGKTIGIRHPLGSRRYRRLYSRILYLRSLRIK